ncbi:MAG: DUF1800 domain-containing protein [Acidobacteria bacterium]|nr:DUF1800 domain-containing protein [Acidobacteriota bacterium]
MRKSLPPRLFRSLLRLLRVCAVLFFCGAFNFAEAAGGPTILTEATSTRAIALEAVTFRRDPFPLTMPVPFSADTRNRIVFFVMNLDLLAGEGTNALTADAEDASYRHYTFKVENVTPLPGYEWMSQVTVRLSDDIGDVGDVLVRFNLHGMSSNRVRVGIGHVGGGPSDDASTIIAAAPFPAPAPTPVPTPNSYTGAASTADTVRFLEQATWGTTNAESARVRAMGFRAYLNEQFNLPASGYPNLTFPPDDASQGCPTGSPPECSRDNYTLYPIQKTFFTNALTGQDQLRQRVAFALHQIMVVSGREINRPSWMTPYLQTLDRNAFGNFRALLQEITLNPAMGEYLDLRRSTTTNQNENYAREVLQLFSIGLYELNRDGTLKLDAQGNPIPTYTQTTVNEFTRVLTGWTFASIISSGITNYRDPMVARTNSAGHDLGSKTLLNGLVTQANQTTTQDLNTALDNIFNHPNVGPFISKQLIQHLVTSNPSPAYVERVARVFNNDCDALYADNCTNARGNLRAVVQAILLDPEARGDVKTDPNYGHLREPIQFMNNVLRAFDAKSFDKSSTSDGVLAIRSTTDFPTAMDQPLFLPATVFSYYQFDYAIPGTNLLGPSFQILSTSTTLRRANFVNSMVYTGIAPTTGTNTDRPRGTSFDLSPLEALASNPQQLVGQLDSLLMHGTMSTLMRTEIVNAISSIPTSDANFARKRAQMAVYLAATSSQYQVQR